MQVYNSLGIYDVFLYRYCNNKGPCPDPITSKYLPFEKNGVITEKMSSMIETFSNLELRQVCILSLKYGANVYMILTHEKSFR
jgi:hypothetical protein